MWIPNCFQINTKSHFDNYSDIELTEKYRGSLINLRYDFNVTNEIKTLLNCGIGIYSTNPKLKLPKNYRDYILELASSSQLAFIISDSSISYGTNLPFNNVIITSDLAKIHSINTIFQIMGRAGRLGISESCN